MSSTLPQGSEFRLGGEQGRLCPVGVIAGPSPTGRSIASGLSLTTCATRKTSVESTSAIPTDAVGGARSRDPVSAPFRRFLGEPEGTFDCAAAVYLAGGFGRRAARDCPEGASGRRGSSCPVVEARPLWVEEGGLGARVRLRRGRRTTLGVGSASPRL